MSEPQSHRAIGARLAASFANVFSKANVIPSSVGPHARVSGRTGDAGAPESIKSSLTGPLIALQSLRQPVWMPRDSNAFAREGFMQNAIVYRCVRMIAEAAASVPILLYSGDEEIETHPLLDLLRRPNPLQTGPDLLESVFGHLLVSGNAYLECVSIDGEVRELHSLRPDRMKIVPGPDGWPEAYEYTVGGRSIRIAGDAAPGIPRILHLKLFHPDNDHYGLSPLESAATAIDLHNTAARWNKALLDNSARPSGALVYTSRDGNLSAEQYERLKSELESGFQGSANAGRPLLLEGGLDWKSMSLSPKDMDFIEARHTAAREIALALGVPPMLLGIPGDNTYSNMAEAQRIFWRQTVLPLVNKTTAAVSNWLLSSLAPSDARFASSAAYSSQLHFKPNLDDIEALSPERDALWARLEKTSFLSTDEKRAAIGYGPLDNSTISDEKRFRHDQLRVPAGNTGGGRWTSGESGDDDRDLLHQASKKPGGLPKAVWDLTVRQFVSRYCEGWINRELPRQFEDATIKDIIDMARGGDAAAKKCQKLLKDNRFRK